MRGEHDIYGGYRIDPFGSSPHAWGTLIKIDSIVSTSRFIPTCVGNTPAIMENNRIVAVHPHMRGEHHTDHGPLGLRTGSSPHAWGTLTNPGHGPGLNRFIPTCVGNTAALVYSDTFNPVHPHMRGEHSL